MGRRLKRLPGEVTPGIRRILLLLPIGQGNQQHAQILLAQALVPSLPSLSNFSNVSNLSNLSYCHVPLVVGRDGKRLAKRHGDTRIATFREQGKAPEEILGFLAASCGWAEAGERVTLRDLLSRFDLGTIPHAPFMI